MNAISDKQLIEEENPTRLTLLEILNFIWRKIGFILLGLLIGGSLTYIGTKAFIPPIYESHIMLYVSSGTDMNSSDLNISKQIAPTYIQVLQSNMFIDKAIESLNQEYTRSDIKHMMKISSVADTGLIKIKIQSSDPHEAAMIANTIGEVAPSELTKMIGIGNVKIIDNAEVAMYPITPNMIVNTELGALAGGILTVLALLIYAIFDNRIKDEKRLEAYTQLPSLGTIPKIKK
ncbi:Wzz/FepE/Etk N-terminal domain-containing protein [Niameybacter massiliensis]|uniref:Wzz/FepE/Etk N-terminal domain-containing protein n=1 Tax=Holtiella tumoricola TaxID=3018743 RepID=A0AA42DLR9_9FIRM|nr:Wzz/FepE/Etk N-terminal domain-containing protein [Holtiella tumoricola]MDA3731286.1 Wzz/FepE/Etk N-terminal domain-containing protein [Holtiella tumoricola]